MANEENPQAVSEGEMRGRSALERLSRAVFAHPVTTLALGAGIGALMGAELLAAGLAGGAAVLLLERGNLRGSARRMVDTARQRMGDVGGPSSEQHA